MVTTKSPPAKTSRKEGGSGTLGSVFGELVKPQHQVVGGVEVRDGGPSFLASWLAGSTGGVTVGGIREGSPVSIAMSGGGTSGGTTMAGNGSGRFTSIRFPQRARTMCLPSVSTNSLAGIIT